MNKKWIATVGILLVLGILIPFKIYKNNQSQKLVQDDKKEVHYHAGFVVFDNGKKVDFSDFKYMHIEPCLIEDQAAFAKGSSEPREETPEHTQLEKAHLHDGVGDVVHTHREGAKWKDLFTNLNYLVDYSQTKSFVNGEEVTDIKNYPIKAYDSVVIFVETVDRSLLTQAITVDHIKEIESKSESCGE